MRDIVSVPGRHQVQGPGWVCHTLLPGVMPTAVLASQPDTLILGMIMSAAACLHVQQTGGEL
jgi:hypothetical protein